MEVCESSERSRYFVYPPSVVSPAFENFSGMNDLEEEGEEEARMMNQARLAYWLRRATARRCEGQYNTKDNPDEEFRIGGVTFRRGGVPRGMIQDCIPEKLQMHDKRWVVTLTDITILPRVGETGLGTLEAHLNGFRYSTCCGLHVDFMHSNVGDYFFRLGHGGPPLLQFHLKHPITVENEVTEDVQFHLFQSPLEEVRFRKDSGNVRKAKEVWDSCRDEELKNFMHKVQVTQFNCESTLPFDRVEFQPLEEFKFNADFPKGSGSAIFALTNSALVVLEETPFYFQEKEETPFFVIPLRDLQIVNLAMRHNTEKMDMTVVFEDYNRGVLEICSIPLKFLTGIKHRVNLAGVKYYVNSESRNWSKFVREITEDPEKFKASGGWDSLEDDRTRAYYPLVESAYYPLVESYPDIPTVCELW